MKKLKSVMKQLRVLNIYTSRIIDGKKLQFKHLPNIDIGWYKLWIQLYIEEAKLRKITIPQSLMIEITLALLEDE